MERRPLDFNAPLMSARRYTSPRNSSELVQWRVSENRPPTAGQPSLPPNKYQWESEDITKPASVPFNWEQTPGRPKYEPETPRLPPGRFNSCEIPRLPPGRLSGPSRYLSGDRSNDHTTTVYSDHALLLQKLNDSLTCTDEPDSSETESQEDEYAYSDALNTISLTETCSDSKPKPSGKFCVDKQTRDFMMNRFLPAAKAAVLETPKKKMIGEKPKEVRKVISEKPRDVRKMLSGEILKKPLIMRQYGSDGLPSYFGHPDFDNVESEEDEEHSNVVPVKKSGKSSWGINIPRICVNLNLKNPLPSMKSKSRPPTPSNVEERRFRRNAVSGPLDMSGSQVPPKKKYYSGLITRGSHGLENKNSSSRSSNEPSQQHLNSPNRSGLSPLRRYRSGNISPYRNESPKSAFREGAGFLGLPNINNKEDATKIASSRKMFRALQEVSRTNPVNETGPLGSTAGDLVEEKMVYVDSISRRTVKPKQDEGRKVSSKYSEEAKDVKMYQTGGQESRAMGLRDNHVKLEIKGGDKLFNTYIGGECDDLPLKSRDVGLHTKDVKLEIKGEEQLFNSYSGGECDDLPLKSRDVGLHTKDVKLEIKGEEQLFNSYSGGECHDLPLKSRGVGLRSQEPRGMELHKKDVKVVIEGEKLDNSYIGGECDDLPLKSPLPPPLPKSPSESWLWRTLPSIPLGNPFTHSRRNSQIHSKKQGLKDDTKWETIVKTSNVRHDHARYSEEHMLHLSYRQTKS